MLTTKGEEVENVVLQYTKNPVRKLPVDTLSSLNKLRPVALSAEIAPLEQFHSDEISKKIEKLHESQKRRQKEEDDRLNFRYEKDPHIDSDLEGPDSQRMKEKVFALMKAQQKIAEKKKPPSGGKWAAQILYSPLISLFNFRL